MELLIEDNKTVIVVMIMVEHIGDGCTEREGEIIAIAASADKGVVSSEHFLPTIYQFLKLSKVFEVHILKMLPLKIDIDFVLRCVVCQLLILASLYVLLLPIAEERTLLWQTHDVRIPFRCLSFSFFVHQEESYAKLFVVQAAAVLGEQVRALPDDKIKQLWFFFFKGLR